MSRTAIIAGAGPAGLTAALELLCRTDLRPLVFEAERQAAGISKTIVYRGNRMDLGGHRSSPNPIGSWTGGNRYCRSPQTRHRLRRWSWLTTDSAGRWQ